MHYKHVLLAALKSVPGEAEKAGEFANAGELAGFDPLKLHAEHVDDIDFADHLVKIMDHSRAQLLEATRQQRWRADENYFGAELFQPPQIRSGHPAVDDIADNRDFQSRDAAKSLTNRVQIEQ